MHWTFSRFNDMANKTSKCLFVTLTSALAFTGCTGAYHLNDVRDAQDSANNLTVGKVQREIRVGMTSADVIQTLGSPNIVSTDEQRREVWVYDKVATEQAYSTSSGYGTILILGFNKGSGAHSTSQRTLTIVIKFDSNNRVRDFSYHTSRF